MENNNNSSRQGQPERGKEAKAKAKAGNELTPTNGRSQNQPQPPQPLPSSTTIDPDLFIAPPPFQHQVAQNRVVVQLYALYGLQIKKVLTAHSKTAIKLMSEALLNPKEFEVNRQKTWQALATIMNKDLDLQPVPVVPTTPQLSPAPSPFSKTQGDLLLQIPERLIFTAQDFAEITQIEQVVPLMLFARHRLGAKAGFDAGMGVGVGIGGNSPARSKPSRPSRNRNRNH